MLVGKERMFLNAELQKERTVIMEHTFDDVLKAFEGYIRSSSYIDICKTKFGYTVLHFNPGTNSFIYEPEILETPEDMVRCLREEEIKLLILISDGNPRENNYFGETAKLDLQNVKRNLERKGVKMFAAAIDDDRQKIEEIYQDGFLNISDLKAMPLKLAGLLTNYLR